ncbi:mitochondrial 37S ribosomal protein uS5m [Kockiozyma suomiensis]|uniref:mitochondrial 37S ribosomal protein uS5m n=1 Tax=Kockiozyma suomiensis TaxID=1337062 RepID=UPI0033437A5D
MLNRILRISSLPTSQLRLLIQKPQLFTSRSYSSYTGETSDKLKALEKAAEKGDRNAVRQLAEEAGIDLHHIYEPAPTLDEIKIPVVTNRSSHIRRLSEFYSPKMLKAIIASEKAITPDLWSQRKQSQSSFPLSYVDDLSARDKFWDTAVEPWTDLTHDARQIVPPFGPNAEKKIKFEEESKRIEENALKIEVTKGKEAARNYIENAFENLDSLAEVNVSDETVIHSNRLSDNYIHSLKSKSLVHKTVANVTRLGKIRSHYMLVAVGDGNGMVGIGEGRDRDSLPQATAKARAQAIANMVYIPRFENRTIYGPINQKFHGVSMDLWPRRRGFGIRTNHLIHEIALLAGIKDISGKVRGSRNAMNTVKCVIEALQNQTSPEEIAVMRGKKISEVREVYFGGI